MWSFVQNKVQQGFLSGKPDTLMRDALLLELNQEAKQAGGKVTKRLRLVARKLVDRAETRSGQL
jgi:hypothetical protein